MSEDHAASRGGDRPALGGDLVIPILAAAFTIYFLITTAGLDWEARANGVLIGVTLLVLVALQVGQTALKVATGGATLGLGELAEATPAQGRRLALIAILAAFIGTLPWLGTSLGLTLTMAASMAVLGVRSPRVLAGVSLGTAAAVYLLFIALLGAQLPAGPVEDLIARLSGAGG